MRKFIIICSAQWEWWRKKDKKINGIVLSNGNKENDKNGIEVYGKLRER